MRLPQNYLGMIRAHLVGSLYIVQNNINVEALFRPPSPPGTIVIDSVSAQVASEPKSR